MKLTLLATVILASAVSTTTHAADEANGFWGILSASDNIQRAGTKTRWRYGLDMQWRHSERGSGSDQYVLRPSLGYDLNPNITVWAGYGYFLTEPNVGSNRYEHRWWQQINWTAKRLNWGTLSFRTRLEERDLERARDIGLRFRQQLQLAMPLPAWQLTLITSIEHYSNLRDTDWGARSGFDRLRSYAGVRMPVSEKLALEFGYMNQWVNRGEEDAVNHLAVLRLRAKF
ncbi:DUF2490 domain-containing protein [Woeseia oceani]|uniref:DUF2490 domain-containing protein n=1 Tax=Woeseia oceani TaxID=1548547 RepID=A0A193LGR4_9GAMM|nr:DUF2490 domain-containing protein [Woeseia oceani]ANO51653.1 hypothetical protein BA177_10955 [Woeseia oceani]